MYLRNNLFDEDTFSFALNFRELASLDRLCLVARSPRRFQNVNEGYVRHLERAGVKIAVVADRDRECFDNLLRARLIVLPSFQDGWPYRRGLRSENRTVLRIYHGIVTKAYGRLKPEGTRPDSRRLQRGIDARSVASEVELHFRATAEGAHPDAYETWGYPRYDRIYDLLQGVDEPVLHKSSRALLTETGRRNILYAPTHKDRKYATTLFPYADFDADVLRDRLRTHDLNLIIRMHVREEGSEEVARLVDGDRVHRGGRGFSPSVVEALPFIHLIVTDYSSIYMNFLPFDRPVLFLDEDRERFDLIRGLAFDHEKYFPGPKIRSFDEFLRALDEVFERGEDTHAAARASVGRVFLPEPQLRFMACLAEALED